LGRGDLTRVEREVGGDTVSTHGEVIGLHGVVSWDLIRVVEEIRHEKN